MRDRFWFRRGRGAGGDEPPNNWTSHFGDSAWTRTKNPDGTRGDWFLHLFAPAPARPQLGPPGGPRGARGDPALLVRPRRGGNSHRLGGAGDQGPGAARPRRRLAPGAEHPFVDRDEIHDVYRSWRAIADSYDPPRALIGEVWLEDRERFARYLRPDELHGAVQLRLPRLPLGRRSAARVHRRHARQPRAGRCTAVVGAVQPRRHPRGHPLRARRHDVLVRRQAHRHADRPRPRHAPRPRRSAARRRPARDAVRVPGRGARPPRGRGPPAGAHPGSDALPVRRHRPRRDGCRVPLPWEGDEAAVRLRPAGSTPWLPQPASWATLTVAAEDGDPTSMLSLYRDVIALRRDRARRRRRAADWLRSRTACWPSAAATSRCVVNLSPGPVQLPAGTVLITSGPLDERPAPGRHRRHGSTSTTTNQTRNSKEQSIMRIRYRTAVLGGVWRTRRHPSRGRLGQRPATQPPPKR